ncbi:MAG: ORF6N domain-containing protein, partial [Clostridium sp.]
MDKDIIKIGNKDLQVKQYKGQRVVTFKDIDMVHERVEGTASRNFNANKKHFIENVDYFKVCADEIRTHKIMDISNKAREDITFLTETGYLMLVKSLQDDLAWEVQR